MGRPAQLAGVALELFAEYCGYFGKEENLIALGAWDKFNLAFEAKTQKRLDISNYSFAESWGSFLLRNCILETN